jgi:hypothetical protein
MQPAPSAEALLTLAVQYAKQILSGKLTPYQGGRLIWWECQLKLPEGDHRLDPFVYWASEREDSSEASRHALCDHALLTAAANLIAKGSAL